MPNNREWALFFWAAVFAIGILTQRSMRTSVTGLLKSLLGIKIVIPLIILVLWILGLVVLGSKLALWDSQLTTDTAIWFVYSGVVIYVSFNEAWEEKHYFIKKLTQLFAITVLLQGYLALVVLPLWAELIVQPLFAVFVTLYVVAGDKVEYRAAKRFASILLGLATLGLLIYVTVSLATNWNSTDKGNLARHLALPMWLTLGLLLLAYLLALYAAYESAFVRMDMLEQRDRAQLRRNRRALVRALGIHAREVGAFTGSWPFRLAAASSCEEARSVIREFRAERREAEESSGVHP